MYMNKKYDDCVYKVYDSVIILTAMLWAYNILMQLEGKMKLCLYIHWCLHVCQYMKW